MGTVADITAASKAIIAAELTEFSQLDYEHEIEKNNFENKSDRYGFISLGATRPTDVLLGNITFDHVWQLVLTDTYYNADDDTAQTAVKEELFAKAEDTAKQLIHQKFGLSDTVIFAIVEGFEDPEFLDDNTIVVIRLNMTIRYRRSLR